MGFTKTEKKIVLITGLFLMTGMASRYYSIGAAVLSDLAPYGETQTVQFPQQKTPVGVSSALVGEAKEAKEAKEAPAIVDVPRVRVPAKRRAAPVFPLNLNTVSAEDLSQIKGIGPKLARSIVEYRSINGPFSSVQQAEQVKGIGKKRLEKISPFLTI